MRSFVGMYACMDVCPGLNHYWIIGSTLVVRNNTENYINSQNQIKSEPVYICVRYAAAGHPSNLNNIVMQLKKRRRGKTTMRTIKEGILCSTHINQVLLLCVQPANDKTQGMK